MSSIIEGYNYDIFISYRQKDNKHDGWVTEFVNNLKGELESTFKEEISVYFDINPHDGLLDTHDVDESLKEKLKCLIFIPIISRTYCDPKSFAWEHEFKAFVKQASIDQYGLKVKLSNGNVAKRVLPVIIHDLDTADIKECESLLGGMLRGVEFIYKEPGVNKPLTMDDNESKNLNATKYRIQINKIANAIKEIIGALKGPEQAIKESSKEPVRTVSKSKKAGTITGSILALAIVILGILFIPGWLSPKEEIEKSIAVLPFTNLSNDPEQEYFSDGIVEAILNHLFKLGELKVISSTSTKRYKNTELSLKEIGRELGVTAILEGSIQRIGNNVRITVQLIDARNDIHLWSEIYDKNLSDIFLIQSEVAQTVARELKAKLTAEEKEQMMENSTENTEAYDLYMEGLFFIQKRTADGVSKSIGYFEKAIAADQEYALAYAGLADAYKLQTWSDYRGPSIKITPQEAYYKSQEYVKRALELDEDLAEAHAVLGVLLSEFEWKWEEARKELLTAINLNPNYSVAHQYYATLLDRLRENTEARKHIDIALKIDPFYVRLHELSGDFYYNEGKYRESLEAFMKVQELVPGRDNYGAMFLNYLKLEEELKAVEMLEQIFLNSSDTVLLNSANLVKDIYDKAGMNGLLKWRLELVRERTPDDYRSIQTVLAIVGTKEEIINGIERFYENSKVSFMDLVYLNSFNNNARSGLEIVRSEPRIQAIIKKMGLSEYQKPK